MVLCSARPSSALMKPFVQYVSLIEPSRLWSLKRHSRNQTQFWNFVLPTQVFHVTKNLGYSTRVI